MQGKEKKGLRRAGQTKENLEKIFEGPPHPPSLEINNGESKHLAKHKVEETEGRGSVVSWFHQSGQNPTDIFVYKFFVKTYGVSTQSFERPLDHLR